MFSIQNVYMYAYQLIIYTSSSLSSLLVRKAWRNCFVLRTLCWIECWSSPSMVLLDWLYHTTYSSLTTTMMDDEWKHGLFGRKKEKECSDNNHNQITDNRSIKLFTTCVYLSVHAWCLIAYYDRPQLHQLPLPMSNQLNSDIRYCIYSF
jgi:hypothetical protein